tara:strand:+ start:466 stop:603 length:138 start_codon:yes stop_codon:yes gene_type:complete
MKKKCGKEKKRKRERERETMMLKSSFLTNHVERCVQKKKNNTGFI